MTHTLVALAPKWYKAVWVKVVVLVVVALALILAVSGHSHSGPPAVNTSSVSYADGYNDGNDDSASCYANFGAWKRGGDNWNDFSAGCNAAADGMPYGSVPSGN